MTSTKIATAALILTTLAGTATAQVTHTVGPNLTDFDFITITAAIAAASSGDTIVVEPDIYPENLTISGKTLTIENAGGGEVAILGQGLGRCLDLPSGSGSNVTLRGLRFTGGSTGGNGGGITVWATTTALIENCTIDNCFANGFGGGLYVSGTATVRDTVITLNESTSHGGGVYLTGSGLNASFENVTIELNHTGTEGGGMAYASAGERATFKNITFDSNTATNRGGAVANLGAATQGVMRFDQCVFTGNIAGGSSGAIWVSALDYTKAVNCLFINNSAGTTGGAVRNEHLFDAINCTFVGNTATAGADTFETTSGDITLLVNSIVTNSTATSHSGPGFFVLRNSILPEGPSGTPDANGNFNADPMFINQGTGDYRLSSNSPAIDAGRSLGTFGTIDITSISTDLDGLVRNLDDTDTPNTGIPAWELNIDIGAYEFQPTTIADCPADQNFNGTLEAADFTAWISNFNNGCD